MELHVQVSKTAFFFSSGRYRVALLRFFKKHFFFLGGYVANTFRHLYVQQFVRIEFLN